MTTGNFAAGNSASASSAAVHARVHQLAAVTTLDLDDKILAVFEQAQGTAVVGDRGGVQQNETFHGNSIWKGHLARLGVALRYSRSGHELIDEVQHSNGHCVERARIGCGAGSGVETVTRSRPRQPPVHRARRRRRCIPKSARQRCPRPTARRPWRPSCYRRHRGSRLCPRPAAERQQTKDPRRLKLLRQ